MGFRPFRTWKARAADMESQIQVPFEAAGGRQTLGVPLRDASPAVFVDRDGAPMLLDAMTPARSDARIQILATGLGRVQPAWPTGLAAPLGSPPRVVAPVKV